MSRWTTRSVATLTGDPLGFLPASVFPWGRALSTGFDTTCTIPLNEVDYSGAQLADLTAHWKRTIVLEQDGVPVYAGMVRDQDFDGDNLVLGLTDIWGLWERRGTWDRFAPNMQSSVRTMTGLSAGTIGKRAVQFAMEESQPLPVMDLPIILPADVSGSRDQTLFGYHEEFVADVLGDMVAEGADFDFPPMWVDGAFWWRMVTHYPDPGFWEFHVNAPKGGVTNFRRRSIGSNMTNHAIVIGEGSDTATLIYAQADESSDLPTLERIDSRKHIGDPVQLQAIADAQQVLFTPPTELWSFDIPADGNSAGDLPKVGELALGDTVRLWFQGDRRVPADGFYDRRIIRIQGRVGGVATITCDPTGGGG